MESELQSIQLFVAAGFIPLSEAWQMIIVCTFASAQYFIRSQAEKIIIWFITDKQ